MTDISKMNQLMQKAQPIFAQIDQLPPIETVIAQIAVQIWRRFIGRADVNLGALQTRLKVLAYDAGVLGEDLFRILCKLDDFHGEDIRTLRKEKVLQLKDGIKKTDVIRASALKWLKFLEKVSKRHTVGFEARASARKRAREEEKAAKQKREQEERERKEQEAKELANKKLKAAEEAAKRQKDKERAAIRGGVHTARWRPNISHKEYSDGVRVFVELPGLSSEDIQIGVNNRTLEIKGIRNGAPFAESLFISEKFDLDRTSVEFDDGLLVVTLPYSRAHLSRFPRYSRFSYL